MPTLTDCNKISKKSEFGFSPGWPCWTSSRLRGREWRGLWRGHQCLQAREGRCHPWVMAAPVCPTPIAACADRAHAARLCMDPGAGEIQGWVMTRDHQDLRPFVGFPAGVMCRGGAGWCELPLLKMLWGCLTVSLCLASLQGGRRHQAGREGGGCTPSFTHSPW